LCKEKKAALGFAQEFTVISKEIVLQKFEFKKSKSHRFCRPKFKHSNRAQFTPEKFRQCSPEATRSTARRLYGCIQ
jgi:hypothetical protein